MTSHKPIEMSGLSEADFESLDSIGLGSEEPGQRGRVWTTVLYLLFVCSLLGMGFDNFFRERSAISSFAALAVGEFGASLVKAEKAYADSGQESDILDFVNGAGGFQVSEKVVRAADAEIARSLGLLWSEIRREALVPRIDLEQFRTVKKKSEQSRSHFEELASQYEHWSWWSRFLGVLSLIGGFFVALGLLRTREHRFIIQRVVTPRVSTSMSSHDGQAGLSEGDDSRTCDMMPVPIARFESDGKIVFWTQAMARLTGVSVDQAYGAHLLDVFGWSAQGEIGKSAFYRLFLGEPVEGVEWDFQHVSGETLTLSGTLVPSVDRGGSVCGGIVMIQDMTALRRQKDLLVQSESQKNAILRAMSDTLIQVDHLGNLLAIHDNAGLFTAHGYGQIGTLEWQNALPSDAVGSTVEAIKQSLLRPEAPEFEFEGDWNGRFRTLEIRANSYGRSESLVSIKDISTRRLVEDAVRGGETKFKALIEGSADLVMMLSADGRIQYASLAVRQMLGYAESDVVGRNWLDLVSTEDRGRLAERASRWLAGEGETGRIAIRQVRKDGSTLETEVLSRNFLGIEPVDAIVLNIRDVSARRALELELAQRLAEVERTKRALTEAFRRDSVTGLYNFSEFWTYVDAARGYTDDGGLMTLAIVDICDFTQLNRDFGRDIGDEVLRYVGSALFAEFDQPCIVARLSGGEFGILVPGASGIDVLNRTLQVTFGGFVTNGRALTIAVSFGIAESITDESSAQWVARAVENARDSDQGRIPEAS